MVVKIPITYRDALELLSANTREKLFTFIAVHRAVERIEAGGFKLEPPERSALDDATRLLRLALAREVDRYPRDEFAPLLARAFDRIFILDRE